MRPHSLKTKIVTPAVDASRDFYVELFGMMIVEAWDEPDDAGCILAFPGSKREAFLEIYRGPAPPSFVGLGLQFRTDDLDAFVSSLPPSILYRGPVERPWGSRYLYLTDPNGIDLIVFEGGP